MDKTQKAGVKLLAVAVACLLLSIGLPLFTTVSHMGMLRSLAGVFIGTVLILASLFLIRNGDAGDAILGPLGSAQRRRKVRIWTIILCFPALLACGVFYLVLSRHGYRIFT